MVVSGIPGSGKTTLARAVAQEMSLPMISKDTIKEALMDGLGTGDLAWATKLSRTAHLVMFDLVRQFPGHVIIEAHFHHGLAEQDLHGLGRPLVQVYCDCPVDLAWQRYCERRDDPARHPGHLPEHQDESATAGWRHAAPRPLDLDAPLIVVDTSQAVDVVELASRIRRAGTRSSQLPR
ncbi:MAG TPA: AAA family ATPase [Microthrixaceae bacterium]|nr:AAA family ATPase [Microthrixaceae bacterium]